jgi:hypothetical protein
MQLYECTVRLNGSMHNEVHKADVTAAEIVVLRAIHENPEAGVDAILRIKPTKHVDRDDMEERQRLEAIYGAGVANNERLRSLNNLLGHHTAPLPQTVPGVDSLPAPKTGRRARVAKVESEMPADEPEPIEESEFA